MNKDGFYALRIQPIIFMALITIICIVITSALFLFTSDRVKSNELFFLRRSVLDAASVTHDGTLSSVEEAYTSYVTQKGDKYIISDGDSKKAVIQKTGPGLWGPITVMVGFTDPSTLSGVSIVSQNETPGLGARIEEPWFTSQFKGKSGPFRLVEEGTSAGDDEIDGITGATRTSESFRNIINSVVKDGSTIYKDL